MELDELFALLDVDKAQAKKKTHTALLKPDGPYDTKMMEDGTRGPEKRVPDEIDGDDGDA